jgi:hypothetical protein
MKLNSNLIRVRVDEAITMAGDVYVQEEWQTLPPTGEVTDVAPDVTFCKPGDRVFFERYTSISDPFEENVRYCREDAILGIYEDAE